MIRMEAFTQRGDDNARTTLTSNTRAGVSIGFEDRGEKRAEAVFQALGHHDKQFNNGMKANQPAQPSQPSTLLRRHENLEPVRTAYQQ